MTPDERARRVAEDMWECDAASKGLGMSIETVSEGRAVLVLEVGPAHVNGHGICHGGVTFALADSAFAFACNSRNAASVAQHNAISYLAPARLGDVLRAEAHEIALKGRSGITDVTVRNQNGETIAEFRGQSRALGRAVFDEEAKPQ